MENDLSLGALAPEATWLQGLTWISHHLFRRRVEGQGFSPAATVPTPIVLFRGPHSPSADGLRGPRNTGNDSKTLERRG